MPRWISAVVARTSIALLACAIGSCSSEPAADSQNASSESTIHHPVPPVLQVAPGKGKADEGIVSVDIDVRVNITPRAVDRLPISIQGGCRIRPVGSRESLARLERLDSAIVTATETGLRIGRREYAVGLLEIIPDESSDLRVADHWYRGSLRLFRRPEGRVLAVNVVPLEEYVASVVDSEMPAAFPDAARRAQAIAARTYVLHQVATKPRHPRFDVYADVRSQKYLGYQYLARDGRRLAGETADGRRIAKETAGMVCTYRGKIFCTYYSAVCGGRTTLGSDVFSDAAPPLAAVECDWCREASRYRWSNTLSGKKLAECLKNDLGGLSRAVTSLRATGRLADDRSSEFIVSNGARSARLSATDLRRRLPPGILHSPHFTVSSVGEDFVFAGRGHGHGVGLCQWGARGMAEAGRNCVQILHHYYTGAEVVAIRAE